MKRTGIASTLTCVLVLGLQTGALAWEFGWQDISRGNADFKTVLVDSGNPLTIYAGTTKAVFKTEDGGVSWKNVLSVKGQNTAVNYLIVDPFNKGTIFAASGNGLYYSRNSGASWKRGFPGEATALLILPGRICLGTSNGLFISPDNGRTWNRVAGKIGNSYILAITGNLQESKVLYAVSSAGVFKTKDAGGVWERIFVSSPTEDDEAIEEQADDNDEDAQLSAIRYIAADQNRAGRLYLATDKGVYKTEDYGVTWKPVTSYGLLNRSVNFIMVSLQSEIYAVTKSGVFKYTGERWQEASFGLAAGEIRFLAADKQGNLYAASKHGLFKSYKISSHENETGGPEVYLENEPKIHEVQQAAIAYAEVGNEKIKQWRTLAAKKAWLPQVSVGLDRNTTDLWHWEGGSTTKADDDTLRKGNDSVDWDVRLTWDLGELIWNEDQTSIDVRSKLMVQLRDDLLDQVTKTYFERLRVKMELADLGIEEKKKKSDKELRLRELTAMLDALTGGYFSQAIK